MEINKIKNLIFIGTENHVKMINCNLYNREFSLAKNIVETHDSINQIKLMNKPNSTEEILVVVDNSGEIVVITIDLIKDNNKKSKLDKYEVISTKKYNAKIVYHDNSPWSVDCKYPYIIIGSNNRTVFVFNYEEQEKEQEQEENNNNQQNNNIINDSFIYNGNNHNIPYVTISENGSFIGNNSVDASFKIFDFYTGKLICHCKNPKNEWGWGIKFIPKNLFKIKNYQEYELRRSINVSNSVLDRLNMSDLNLTNPSTYDENNYNKIPYEELNEYEKYLKLALIDKYYILSSCNNCAGLFKLDFKKEENTNKKSVVAVPLGKIELNRIYIRDSFMNIVNPDYPTLLSIGRIKNSSRYEFIYYSENLNLFLLGSKAGDLHIFEMNIYYDKDNKLACVEDEPNILISFEEKLAGMKFLENNENGRKVIDVFALTLTGLLYYYKIIPSFNFWESQFEENEDN